MGQFAFSSCVPFGREPHAEGKVGVLLRAAHAEPVSDDLVKQITEYMGVTGVDLMRYQDKAKGQRRLMRMERYADGLRLAAFIMTGDIRAEAWIRPLLQDELLADTFGRALLTPGEVPPVAVESKGAQVCTCFNVSEPQIVTMLRTCSGDTSMRLTQLQGSLKCGTNCGSCIPSLRKLVKETPADSEHTAAA
jgi:assimilatory nitrate reductase catalytic subunit